FQDTSIMDCSESYTAFKSVTDAMSSPESSSSSSCSSSSSSSSSDSPGTLTVVVFASLVFESSSLETTTTWMTYSVPNSTLSISISVLSVDDKLCISPSSTLALTSNITSSSVS